MLGDLIASLERPEVVADVLSTLRPDLAAKVAERAAQASRCPWATFPVPYGHFSTRLTTISGSSL